MRGAKYELERDNSWDLFKPAYTKDDLLWRDMHAGSAAAKMTSATLVLGTMTAISLITDGPGRQTKTLSLGALSVIPMTIAALAAYRFVRKQVSEDLEYISNKDRTLSESSSSLNYMMRSLDATV